MTSNLSLFFALNMKAFRHDEIRKISLSHSANYNGRSSAIFEIEFKLFAPEAFALSLSLRRVLLAHAPPGEKFVRRKIGQLQKRGKRFM
jgi:hypothetical protein